MAIPDVNFNAAGVLTHQPRSIHVKRIRPPGEYAVNGGFIGMAGYDKNREITMVWADDPAHATYAALVTLRNSDFTHTVTWNNPNGSSVGTIKVFWDYDPEYTVLPGSAPGVFQDITVVLRERPD